MNASISSSRPIPAPSEQSPAPSTHELVIGGITPFTTIDFPGRLAAVLYTQGCAWDCRYCHNAHLQPFTSEGHIPFKKVMDFLKTRVGLLEGVVFCGGEPTAQKGLAEAMRSVKALGFQIALHTAGIYPDGLRGVLPQCDWVGMDVKAPFDRYESVTQRKNSGLPVRQSLQILLESGIDHEVRTTWHPSLLSEKEVLELAGELSGLGVKHYVLQAFQSRGCQDPELLKAPLPAERVSEALRAELSRLFTSFKVRT